MGDGTLMEFGSVVDAVNFAVDVQRATLTKEMFLNHLYGGMDEPELKIIDVFVCKLRKKLDRGLVALRPVAAAPPGTTAYVPDIDASPTQLEGTIEEPGLLSEGMFEQDSDGSIGAFFECHTFDAEEEILYLPAIPVLRLDELPFVPPLRGNFPRGDESAVAEKGSLVRQVSDKPQGRKPRAGKDAVVPVAMGI